MVESMIDWANEPDVDMEYPVINTISGLAFSNPFANASLLNVPDVLSRGVTSNEEALAKRIKSQQKTIGILMEKVKFLENRDDQFIKLLRGDTLEGEMFLGDSVVLLKSVLEDKAPFTIQYGDQKVGVEETDEHSSTRAEWNKLQAAELAASIEAKILRNKILEKVVEYSQSGYPTLRTKDLMVAALQG